MESPSPTRHPLRASLAASISLVASLFVTPAAFADAPLVFCRGAACGGPGPADYAYRIDSGSYPMMELRVGTNDLDPAHYQDVVLPAGWHFTIEDTPTAHAHGVETPHGEVSPGPCWCLTRGTALWWTDDPDHAVEFFTFAFDHASTTEDVDWSLLTRRAGPPPEYYEFGPFWDAGVGEGVGPLHGPHELRPVLHLGLGEQVQDEAGATIEVPGYSVPSFTHWDGDVLADLVIGEGGGLDPGKVRIYPNQGSPAEPLFADYFYAQSEGGDLTLPAIGCLGAFPRVVQWDGDGRKDLLIGVADGTVRIYLNTGTNADPVFDGGTALQVGAAGAKIDIDVGDRATSVVSDWDSDGRKDLVVGALDGLVRVFLNEGSDTEPDFVAEMLAQANGVDLEVPSARSSPEVLDLDGDGRKDLLCGNTDGELLLYSNVGDDEWPVFGDPVRVEAAGTPIDLDGAPRSRPSICRWTDDLELDVLIGSEDGTVRLYQGISITPFALSLTPDPLVGGALATLTLSGATPRAIAASGYSLTGLGHTYVPPLGIFVDLDAPRPGGIEGVGPDGSAVWSFWVPELAEGRELWLQAAEPVHKSNVIATSVR